MKISWRSLLAVAVITSILFLAFHQNKVQPLTSLQSSTKFAGADRNSRMIYKKIPKINMLQLCNCQSKKESCGTISTPSPMETDERIEEIFSRMDKLIPKISIGDSDEATSAEETKATIIDPKDHYCIGDQLHVKVEAYDYTGNRKSYGGDYLRARIYSPATNSSASGSIVDNYDGTYSIKFTLFWEGTVHLSILLMHPSEAVSALWRGRNQGFANIKYTGNFTSATEYVNSDCGFQLDTEREVCRYVDKRDREAFYCIKPKDFPCETLTHMNSVNRDHSYLTEVEQLLLNRSNIGLEISNNLKSVNVVSCGKKRLSSTEKCSMGSYHPMPSGYFHRNVWNPIHCKMTQFTDNDKLKDFFKGKKLFLLGDSTVRQYIRHFAEDIKIVDYFNHTEDEMQSWQKTLLAINLEKFIYVQWKKHTFPFVSKTFYSIKEDAYMARQIDQIGGGENTIIVLTLGQHFRPFPLRTFIRSAINIRRAIERLFYRSPRTRVIIKEENAREMDIDMERFSDFHGHVQYLVLRDIFHGLNVGFVDVLDMSIAYACNVIHPPLEVLENIISMSFTQAL
ncbi:NXPE family member 4-like isoform X1 [Mixophyes fleayi]|uniref:NXPE family member 4-like isoform X1 n=1 Tax=Mixophyes fleayi TaxID=3061075 RepID=UPI003F4E106A